MEARQEAVQLFSERCPCSRILSRLQPGEHSGFEGRVVETAMSGADSPGSAGRSGQGLQTGAMGSHGRAAGLRVGLS